MDVKSLIKNKFIIAIPVALLLFGCLYKFNEFRNINKEDDDDDDETKPKQDIKYYIKAFIICYLLGIVFVILIKKGYNYYINGTKTNNSILDTFDTQSKEKLQVNEDIPFDKEKAIIKRETELDNDIKDLNVDIDTSTLESVEIPTSQLKIKEEPPVQPQPQIQPQPSIEPPSYPKDNSLEKKKQMLLEKRKKLLALKNQQKKPKKIEHFQTGTPNF